MGEGEVLQLYNPTLGLLTMLLTTTVAIAASWGILYALDKLNHRSFGVNFFPILEKDPKALSFYLSTRFASVLAFMAYQLGRFV